MSDFEFDKPVAVKPQKGGATTSNIRGASVPPVAASLPKEILEADHEAKTSAEPELDENGNPKIVYDPEELASIFDEIIFQGEYSEEIIVRNKLRVRIRTRTAEEIEAISMVVDTTKANLVATLAEKRSLLNLQYALQFYNGKDLRMVSLEEKAKFIGRLPGPIIGALLTAMGKFDAKVYEACKDGEENF